MNLWRCEALCANSRYMGFYHILISVSEIQNSFKLYFGGQKLHTLAHLSLLPKEKGKQESCMWLLLQFCIRSPSANIALLQLII